MNQLITNAEPFEGAVERHLIERNARHRVKEGRTLCQQKAQRQQSSG